MNFKNITYRKKSYFNYEKNTKTHYYAINLDKNVLIMSNTEHLKTREKISSIFHTFDIKNNYNHALKEIYDNEKYMITKHEFNRLFKEFKEKFRYNCFV